MTGSSQRPAHWTPGEGRGPPRGHRALMTTFLCVWGLPFRSFKSGRTAPQVCWLGAFAAVAAVARVSCSMSSKRTRVSGTCTRARARSPARAVRAPPGTGTLPRQTPPRAPCSSAPGPRPPTSTCTAKRAVKMGYAPAAPHTSGSSRAAEVRGGHTCRGRPRQTCWSGPERARRSQSRTRCPGTRHHRASTCTPGQENCISQHSPEASAMVPVANGSAPLTRGRATPPCPSAAARRCR